MNRMVMASCDWLVGTWQLGESRACSCGLWYGLLHIRGCNRQCEMFVHNVMEDVQMADELKVKEKGFLIDVSLVFCYSVMLLPIVRHAFMFLKSLPT